MTDRGPACLPFCGRLGTGGVTATRPASAIISPNEMGTNAATFDLNDCSPTASVANLPEMLLAAKV
jgi:hypothetical protein